MDLLKIYWLLSEFGLIYSETAIDSKGIKLRIDFKSQYRSLWGKCLNLHISEETTILSYHEKATEVKTIMNVKNSDVYSTIQKIFKEDYRIEADFG